MSARRRPAEELLREVPEVRQHPGERPRRWFTSPSMDLYLWRESDAAGYGAFELCYGKPDDEHSLRFERERGFSHARIDDGETDPKGNATPIAVPDGVFDTADIAARFEAAAGEVDGTARAFVLGALRGG